MLKKFSYKNWSIVGSSIASDQTSLLIREFGICFDMGFTFPDCVKKAKIVAVSHGHQDHLGSLHLHIRKRLRNNLPGATYIIPKVCHEPFRQMYSSVIALDEGKDTVEQTNLPNVNVKFSDETLNHQINAQTFLKSYEMVHKIDSRGYVIFETRRKLKPEYAALSIIQLEKLKLEDLTIKLDTTVNVPLIAFSGDTTIEGVLRCEDMLNSKLLILECTYIDDKVSPEECKNRGHVHLQDVLQHWSKFNNEHVLLVHLSPRYTQKDVEKAYSFIPEHVRKRVTFFDQCPKFNQ